MSHSMKILEILMFIIFISNLIIVYGTSSFNYEVGYRVKDNIEDYLSEISKVVLQPYQMIHSGIFNITLFESYDMISSPDGLPKFFYTLKSVYYDEINTLAAGFYNGILGTYSNDNDKYMLFTYIDSKYRRTRFTVKSNGQPDVLYATDSFNLVTNSLPYILASTRKIRCWSSPFILQSAIPTPVISLVYPLLNLTFAGQFKNFGGTIIGTISLHQISLFLSKAYKNSNRNVFIVEKSTGTLVANSMDSSVSVTINGKLELVQATESENSVISGASQLLLDGNCLNNLVIYKDSYLQCTIYTHTLPGIEWYIVVLLPAVLETDYLGSTSWLYYLSIVVITLSMIITFLSLFMSFVCWDSRMMQLSQPVFTVMVQIGCMLLCGACITLLGKNDSYNCNARAYFPTIAMTITFAPLCIKCWQVYFKFVSKWSLNANQLDSRRKLLGAWGLLFYVLLFVIVDIIISTVTLYSNGTSYASPYTATKISINGAYTQFTYCGFHNNSEYFYAHLSYKALLVLVSCYLSFAIRSVSDAIAGSKSLLAIVYNTAFVGAIVVALNRGMENVEIIIACEIIGICYCVVVAAVLVIAPTVYTIARIGDKAGAAEVIVEMVEARQSTAQRVGIDYVI